MTTPMTNRTLGDADLQQTRGAYFAILRPAISAAMAQLGAERLRESEWLSIAADRRYARFNGDAP